MSLKKTKLKINAYLKKVTKKESRWVKRNYLFVHFDSLTVKKALRDILETLEDEENEQNLRDVPKTSGEVFPKSPEMAKRERQNASNLSRR